ncbi:MAG: AI-2E family transporter [Proteobacteria bacterium]|nr:AI-2E family transporter [Pseudomonadota bacterium]
MPMRQRWFFPVVLLFCLIILQALWYPLAAGMILAFLSEAPNLWLIERFQFKRERSKFFTAFALVLFLQSVFIAPLVLLTWSGTRELLSFWAGLSGDSSARENWHKTLEWLDHSLSPWLQKTGLDINFADLIDRIQESIQPILTQIAVFLGNVLSSTPQLILFVLVTWMAWVYFLIHGKRQREYLLPKLIPWPEERYIICSTMADVLRAMVLTSVVLASFQALLVTLSLGLVGIPKYYLWGACAFFLSFIPIFGTAPIMIGSAAFCYYHERPIAALVMLGMSLVIGLCDNLIRPLLMKGSSDLNFFWMFMSIVGGVALLGLPGAVLGPWAFTMFLALQDPIRS